MTTSPIGPGYPPAVGPARIGDPVPLTPAPSPRSDLPSIYELMPRVLGSVGAVGKDRRNEHHDYSYRSAEAIKAAVQPAMAAHGVSLTFVIEELELTMLGKQRLAKVRVRYSFFGPRGDHIDVLTYGEGADMQDKAIQKATTAALKYALQDVFVIAAPGPDSDADAGPAPARDESPPAWLADLRRRTSALEASHPHIAKRLRARMSEERGKDVPIDLSTIPAGDDWRDWATAHVEGAERAAKREDEPAQTATINAQQPQEDLEPIEATPAAEEAVEAAKDDLEAAKCPVEGCDWVTGGELCSEHTPKPEPTHPDSAPAGLCDAPDCDRVATDGNWCSTHVPF